MTDTALSYSGVGLYTIPEAARFIREPREKLSRWASGYTFRHVGEERRAGPVIDRTFPELVSLRILTFLDLIELKFVGVFRQLGYTLQRVRQAREEARKRLGTPHPLATRAVHTGGAGLLLELAHDGEAPVIREARSTQMVFDELARPFYRDLEYKDDLANLYWPLGREKGVVLDPSRCFGKPIDAASGVPTRVLYEMWKGGSTPDQVAWWYEVEPAAVRSAIEFEEWVSRP